MQPERLNKEDFNLKSEKINKLRYAIVRTLW
nr:MAG TPA: hypothetical protein [Caudoviricetes sp.]